MFKRLWNYLCSLPGPLDDPEAPGLWEPRPFIGTENKVWFREITPVNLELHRLTDKWSSMIEINTEGGMRGVIYLDMFHPREYESPYYQILSAIKPGETVKAMLFVTDTCHKELK